MEKELFLTPMKGEYNEEAIPLPTGNWLSELIALIVAFFKQKSPDPVPEVPVQEIPEKAPDSLEYLIKRFNPEISTKLIDNALKFIDHSAVTDKSILTLIDFNLPSYEFRLFLIDAKTGKLIDKDICAHGEGSDPKNTKYCVQVSNVSGSHMSSRGAMVFGEGYTSSKKSKTSFNISRRIDGLEEGINHLVRPRAIVLHDASYVTIERKNSKTVGRSWGCLVPTYQFLKNHNDKLKGTLVYVQHG